VITNIGTVERIVRVIVGIAILSLLFILDGSSRWWGLFGLVPILTGATGYCPPFHLLGFSTTKKKSKDV